MPPKKKKKISLILLALICWGLKCYEYFYILLLTAYTQAIVGEGTAGDTAVMPEPEVFNQEGKKGPLGL